jgi:hypothetical protein
MRTQLPPESDSMSETVTEEENEVPVKTEPDGDVIMV